MVKTLVLLVILAVIAGIFWLLRGSGAQRLERLSHQQKRPEAGDELVGLSTKEKALAKLRHSRQFYGVQVPPCRSRAAKRTSVHASTGA